MECLRLIKAMLAFSSFVRFVCFWFTSYVRISYILHFKSRKFVFNLVPCWYSFLYIIISFSIFESSILKFIKSDDIGNDVFHFFNNFTCVTRCNRRNFHTQLKRRPRCLRWVRPVFSIPSAPVGTIYATNYSH